MPNERSSHVKPVPRGGGLVVVLVSLSAYLIFTSFGARRFCWQYFTGALLVAFISWLDDLYTIRAIWRLLVHTAAALLIVSALSANGVLAAPSAGIYSLVVTVFIFLWIVWLTNAYNFMDGIDGIAGLQAVVAGFGWLAAGTVLKLATVEFYGGILAFSSLGFLMHNWQPAKIFMGDVGSAFFGYTFAVLPCLAAAEGGGANLERLLAAGAAFCWLFIFDTGFTFCRRALNGEKVWEAHRTHIYQRMVGGGVSHATAAGIYGGAAAFAGIFAIMSLSNAIYRPLIYGAAAAETIFLLVLWRMLAKR